MFENKYWWVCRSALDRSLVRDLALEWRAQIVRCMDYGLKVRFLNSHEHVHMLPGVYTMVCELAAEFNIPFVRYSTTDWFYRGDVSGMFRNTLIGALDILAREYKLPGTQPRMFGLSASGRLDFAYLKSLIEQLRPGEVGELMCHPGFFEASEVLDPGLLEYHEWEKELDALLGTEFQALRKKEKVELIGFQDLEKKLLYA